MVVLHMILFGIWEHATNRLLTFWPQGRE